MMPLIIIPSAPDYFAELETGKIWSVKGPEPKPLKGGNSRGYRVHSLMIDGRQVTRLEHRLIAEAAYGPCPDGMECCHINGKRDDNRADNLKWATSFENNGDDKRASGKLRIGSKHQNAKLCEFSVRWAREAHKSGQSIGSIARWLGVSHPTIKRAITKQTWRHVK